MGKVVIGPQVASDFGGERLEAPEAGEGKVLAIPPEDPRRDLALEVLVQVGGVTRRDHRSAVGQLDDERGGTAVCPGVFTSERPCAERALAAIEAATGDSPAKSEAK